MKKQGLILATFAVLVILAAGCASGGADSQVVETATLTKQPTRSVTPLTSIAAAAKPTVAPTMVPMATKPAVISNSVFTPSQKFPNVTGVYDGLADRQALEIRHTFVENLYEQGVLAVNARVTNLLNKSINATLYLYLTNSSGEILPVFRDFHFNPSRRSSEIGEQIVFNPKETKEIRFVRIFSFSRFDGYKIILENIEELTEPRPYLSSGVWLYFENRTQVDQGNKTTETLFWTAKEEEVPRDIADDDSKLKAWLKGRQKEQIFSRSVISPFELEGVYKQGDFKKELSGFGTYRLSPPREIGMLIETKFLKELPKTKLISIGGSQFAFVSYSAPPSVEMFAYADLPSRSTICIELNWKDALGNILNKSPEVSCGYGATIYTALTGNPFIAQPNVKGFEFKVRFDKR